MITLQKRLAPVTRGRRGPGWSGRAASARRRRGDQVSNVNYVTFTIVLVLFLLVTLTGFAAARWRRAET